MPFLYSYAELLVFVSVHTVVLGCGLGCDPKPVALAGKYPAGGAAPHTSAAGFTAPVPGTPNARAGKGVGEASGCARATQNNKQLEVMTKLYKGSLYTLILVTRETLYHIKICFCLETCT
jgi:hypothetical protein